MKLIALIALLGASIADRPATPRIFHHENVLGTSLELKLIGGSEADSERAETAVLNEIDRLNRILSTWSPNSEVNRWTRTHGQPIAVSNELFDVLGLYDQYRKNTLGVINASAETATRLWKKGQPGPDALAAAVATMGLQHWSLDAANHTATHLTEAPLALNSFTKSYIIGKAAEAAMASPNIVAAVVNIGGDLIVRGNWTERVVIADPRDDTENSPAIERLATSNQAVATSGNYRRGSHIIDPRTARPADGIISSTVVADSATDAGAMATAFSILKPEESEKIATAKGVEYLLIARNGAKFHSRNWTGIAMSPAPVPVPADGAFDTSYELIVNLEVARITDGRARRPYLAVWIEDKDKFPVRTVALWLEKTRWLPDLKAWYRDDKMRSMAEGNDITSSVSSATRPPGKYTLKWDGKDNAGKLVKAGKYTVCIEAAREHGTYQLIRQEVDFTGTPQQFPLAGNVEISSASLDYRKTVH